MAFGGSAALGIHTTEDLDEIRALLEMHSGVLHLLDATGIARDTRSRLNMPLLAQLCRVMGFPDAALEDPIVKKWPRQVVANLAAFRAARDGVRTRRFEADGRHPLRPPRPVRSRMGYDTMLDGGAIRAVKSLSIPKEGSHRSLSSPPNFNREACIDCVLCLTVCPDPGALVWREDKMTGIDRAMTPDAKHSIPSDQAAYVCDGNHAAAKAILQAGYDAEGYYPITPSTGVGEAVSEAVASGATDMEFVIGTSELAVAGIVTGMSIAGGRAVDVTSANGLMLKAEQMPVISGLGLPVVLNLSTRAISAPLNIPPRSRPKSTADGRASRRCRRRGCCDTIGCHVDAPPH